MGERVRLLVVESETPDAREERRRSTGRSSGETYCGVLRSLCPEAEHVLARPADEDTPPFTPEALARFDGVFLTGSPLHVYEDSPAVQRQLAFMRALFASATPSFGSCAGLQVAVAAAGGQVRAKGDRHEAGIARRIVATPAGQGHPLLHGRPACWDALTIHGDEVASLPPGARLLATNASTAVQAVEIVHDRGTFWGVQYHPEIPLREMAQALRRQADQLVEQGLARAPADVEAMAGPLAELDGAPSRVDLAWRLGVDRQVTDPACRTLELRNFLDHLVQPVRLARGRASPESATAARDASAPAAAATTGPRPGPPGPVSPAS